MASPLWVDTWPPADLDTLVYKREIERKKWGVIASEMSRPLGTCFHRYTKIARARDPEIVAQPEQRKQSLHEELRIETFVHRQAVLCEPDGGRGRKGEYGSGYDPINRCWSNNHLFRASVTLAKVFA